MLKIGVWQIIEALTVIYNIYFAFSHRGEPVMKLEAYNKYLETPEHLRSFIKLLTFGVMFLLGPLLAILGGCRGVYLLLYASLSFGLYLYGMSRFDSGKIITMRYSPVRSVLTMTAYNVLLYLGGFWTTN